MLGPLLKLSLHLEHQASLRDLAWSGLHHELQTIPPVGRKEENGGIHNTSSDFNEGRGLGAPGYIKLHQQVGTKDNNGAVKISKDNKLRTATWEIKYTDLMES